MSSELIHALTALYRLVLIEHPGFTLAEFREYHAEILDEIEAYLESPKCACCNERPSRYGDPFCSDACAKAFELLQKQQEFLDGLKELPEEERIKALQKATDEKGIMRMYIDPLLPGQEQVLGYKQDRVREDSKFISGVQDSDILEDSDDELCNEMATARRNLERYCFKTGSMLDHWRGDNHILELLIRIVRKRFQHYQDLLEKADEENANL